MKTKATSKEIPSFNKPALIDNASFDFKYPNINKESFMHTTLLHSLGKNYFARIFLTLLIIGFAWNVTAQNAGQYAFSTSGTASLAVDKNGNTVDMTTGTSSIVAAGQDDASSSLTNIGFSFTFFGQVYTAFSASSNGGIRLGAVIGTATLGSSFPVSGQPILAPYLGDLNTSSSGKVHYKLLGVYPNRTLVVEFLNMGVNYNSTGANSTYQARLYEQTNVIEYVYGTMAVGSITPNSTSSRTAIIGFSNTTGANNQFSVNQSTYATSTTATPIANTNSVTGAITTLTSAANGSRRSFTFIPTLAFKSQFISMNLGSATWCAGETRSVSVTIKNIGTSAWSDASPDVNIGIKWNLNGSNWTDYYIRTDAGNLAPGATQTYTFSITASDNTGAGYTTPLAGGTNNLTFDIVKEADCWLGDNGGSCGPGNIKFTSANQTINAFPAITPGSNPLVCQGSTTANLSYSAATGAPNQYSIDYDAAANAAGFTDAFNVTLPATPIVLTVPAGVATGTYNAVLTVRNTSTGCVGAGLPVTVSVNPVPSITLGASPSVCKGITSANLPYSGATGSPNQYSIDYSAAANTAGFTDITNVTLPASPVVLAIPAGAAAGIYSATLTVRNSSSGCVSNTLSFTVTVVAPTVSITGPSTICQGASTSLSPTSGGTWVSNSASATVDNAGNVTGVSQGTATFTFTETATGCSNTTSAVTINGNSSISLSSAAGTDAQTKCINNAITNISYQVGGGGTGASITAGALPAGVTGTYNSGTKIFTISGTPTVSGNFSYTVTTAGPCINNSLSGTITVTAASSISLSSAAGTDAQTKCINNAITNIVYTVGGTATGASITSGALPAGVTGGYDGISQFIITGTPSVSGVFNYTVSSTGPCPLSLSGTITVNANSTIALTSAAGTDDQTKCINNAITNITYLAGGGATGVSITSGALPAGVTGTYNSGTKVFTISGTPTVAGIFTYSVTTAGPCINLTLNGSITVVGNSTLALTSGAGTNIQTVCQNTAITPITYTVGGTGTGANVSGLPSGVAGSYSGNVFTISGTPTVSGSFNYTVTTTGPCVNPSLTGTISLNPQPTGVGITASANTICIGNSVNLTAAGAVSSIGTASSENFNTNGSFVYVAAGSNTGGGNAFQQKTSPATIGLTSITNTDASRFMLAGATSFGTASTTSTLTSPVINTGAYSTLSLSFRHTYTKGQEAGVSVQVSTDAGNTVWSNISTSGTIIGTNTFTSTQGSNNTFATVTINLSSFVNNANFRIRFNYISNVSFGTSWWGIDDVTLSGTLLPLFSWSGNTAAGINGLPAGASTPSLTNKNITVNPTATTIYTLTVKDPATNCGISTATATVNVNQNSTISLSSAPGTNAQTICINNPLTAITYAIGGGGTGATVTATLPAGISGSYNGGVYTITGTPTVSGVFSYTVTTTGPCVNNSLGGSITVNANSSISLSSAAGTDAQTKCINNALSNISYTIAGGGTGASVLPGSLPTGVTGAYNSGTKVFTISGTPTQSGVFNYTVMTAGPCINASLNGTITVNANSTISLSSAAGTDGQTVCINNAITDISYTIGGGGSGASITAGGLPAGVSNSFSGGVFTITGTPTVSGIFNYTVTTAGPCVNNSLSGTITINANSTISLSSAAGTDGQAVCINNPIVNITYAIGGGGTGASISAGSLPAGVTGSYNGGVYTISGTPTASGVFNYTVATAGPCINATLNGTITVNANSTISLSSAAGTDGQTVCINNAITDVNYTIADGGTGASITAGTLPAGVSSSFSAGVFTISGTPTVSGVFNYTVTTAGPCVNNSLSGTITVNANSTISLSSAAGTDGQAVCINNPIVNITYAIGGGGTGASISAGSLPAGVTGSYNGGVYTIIGTPTASGVFSYTVATAGPCINATLNGTITVNANSTISLSSAAGTDGQTVCINNAITDISYTIADGGTGASITAGALPAGVNGSFSNGVFTITGTPTVSGSFNYTVTTAGPCVNNSLSGTITVNANSTISLSSAVGTDAQSICINNPVVNIFYAIGGGGTGASISAGSLPAGVTGSYNDGVYTISGTPTASGVFNYTVATAGPCINATLNGTITVNANSTISLSSAAGTDGQTVCINNAITDISYIIADGGTGASITAGALPAGVNGSFSNGVFTITGTPTVSGSFNYTVTTAGPCVNNSLSGTITINANSTIGLSSAAGTDGQAVCINNPIVNITYAIGGGGTGASISAGSLPAGVTGSYNGGVYTISGTPSESGVFTYTINTDGPCINNSLSGTITVNPAAAAPVSGGDQAVCSNGDPLQTLTATATGGTITWYDAATGGNVVTPTQTGVGTSTYYAESFNGTCISATRTAVILTINAVPAAPISGGDQVVCENGDPLQTLTAVATGGTITWYDAATNGNVTTPKQVGPGTSTYYAESSNGTCSSLTRTAVTLTINAAPAAPVSGGDQVVCSDGNPSQTITATATGGTITWYDAATNGNIVTPQQVGPGTSVYYAQSSNGTCNSLTRTAVTLTINTVPAAPVSGGDQVACENGNPLQTLTATASGGTITWYNAATNGNVTTPTQVGVGTSTYYAEASNGNCSSLSRTAVTLTINPAPAAPLSGGNQSVCSDGTATQTLTAAASGGTITWYNAASGGNIVTPTLTGVGTVTYYAESSNGSCSSLTRTSVMLTINALPATATVSVTQPNCTTSTGKITISAPTGAGFTYSIGGAYQSSPVFSSLTPGTYNNIHVTSNFGCTSVLAATATVNPQPFTPAAPLVTGIVNVCPYLGNGAQITYTASSAGATGYVWTLPANTSVVSGAGTSSITITFDSAFRLQGNKQIRVVANSACGTSAQTLYVLVAQYPSTPGAITGPVNICSLIGTANTATYTINKVLAATSYAWSTQANTTSVVHPNGPGINDTVIVVTFGSGFSSSPVTVAAVNGCGTSGSVRTLMIPRTSAATPGLISGPSNICANILPNGTAATYTIAAIPGATSYTWVTPANAVVTHPNGTGINDVTITVQFPSGFSGGSISVSATNGCGTGAARVLNLTRLNPATPSVIDVIQMQSCPNRIYSYTLSAVPANSTSLNWTIPATPGTTIVSQTSTSITVSYPTTSVQGNVTVQSVNNCASSTIRSSIVRLPACETPPPPPPFVRINQQPVKKSVQPVPVVADPMNVKVYPNPTVSDFKLQVITAGKEAISVRIIDIQGKEFNRLTVMPYQTITLGSELKPGTYMVETRQGKEVKVTKLIKF